MIPRTLALLALLISQFIVGQNPAGSHKSVWTPSLLYGQTAARQANKHSNVREGFVAVTGGRVWYKVVFENSAHMAMLEERDRYIETVRSFLKETERQAQLPLGS